MSVQLLATKLRIPPRPGELVPRARLLEQLDRALTHKLTLVSAPAGFGKTTLVAAWASNRQEAGRLAAGWLDLEANDNDLFRFLNYLVAAVDAAQPGMTGAVQALLNSPHPPPAHEVLTALINQIVAPGEPHRDDTEGAPIVLVLDDYHLVTAPEIHQAVTFLLEYEPARLHLVLVTRADPPLPLPLLRSQGQLLELRHGDLRFTAEEAAVFLREVMSLVLDEQAVATLAHRTEGWIAGLQMAALALRGRRAEETAEFVAGFTGTHRYVLDYLLEEVLQRQPERVQQFLMQTSILQRLTAPLCDALLGSGEPSQTTSSAQEILDYLDTHNLFLVPLDEQRCWYRYHRLFADLLRLRLEQTAPGLLPALHERAADWYEAQGDTSSAIPHLVQAGQTDRALALVAANAEAAVMRGEIMTLLTWVESLPEAAVAARPHLVLLYAWAMLLGGRPARAIERWLREVEAREETAGWTQAIRAYLQLFQEEPGAARQLAERALEALPAQAVFLRQLALLVQSTAAPYLEDGSGPEEALGAASRASAAAENALVAVLGLCMRANLALSRGNLFEARANYQQALEMATDASGRLLPMASEPLVGLATVALERFDLAEAEELLEAGIALTRQWSAVTVTDGYLLRARLHYLRREPEAMWSALDEAAAMARRIDALETDDLLVALARGQMELLLGRQQPVRRWLEERGLRLETAGSDLVTHSSPLRKYEYLLLARLLVARQQPEEALDLLALLAPRFERLREHISIHLLEALAREQLGERENSWAALAEALALGQASGLVTIFVEEGEAVARLLYQALERKIVPEYAGRLLAAFPGEARRKTERRQQGDLLEPLSDRERDVLSLIAQGLTNQEIADRLFLSLATIKWHTSNIYGKLGVGNRTEAVARAHLLGLLPPEGPFPHG